MSSFNASNCSTSTTSIIVDEDSEPPEMIKEKAEEKEIKCCKQSRCNGVIGTEIVPAVRFSWVSPKLRPMMCPTGSGLYVVEDIKAGEHLVVWTGRIMEVEEALFVMNTEDRHYILQIGERWYQLPISTEREAADWTNHSCNPNAGFGKGSPICLSAMRDIKVGEQVCFDYGMCETDERLWEPMDCLCGSSFCRGKITVNDWKISELRVRYKGFFSPHVQRLIDEDEGQKAAAQPMAVAVAVALASDADAGSCAPGVVAAAAAQSQAQRRPRKKRQPTRNTAAGWASRAAPTESMVSMTTPLVSAR